jgi:uncharacterized protein
MVVATIRRPLSGRREARETLGRLVGSDKAEFLAVYGRRRVGKTFLIRRFFQETPVVYFEMVGRFEASVAEHLRIFSESLSRTYHQGVTLAPPESWHAAFRALQAAIEAQPRSKKHRKTVLFFDELPWMATHRSGLLRELEHFWNAWCSRRDDVVLVVCGSAASWMLQKIVHAKGGLHNRLTQTIRLLPFTIAEVKEFLHDRNLRLTHRQIAELVMVFGGIPHYLDHLARGQSVPQLVDRTCFRKDGPLVGELDRLFASLFGADPKYTAVVRALAKKRSGLTRNELLAELDLISGGGITTVLDNLDEGGFISVAIPFGRTSRDRVYRLTDPFTLFSLKWMQGRPPTSWQKVHGTPRWHTWAGLAFETFSLENVAAIERALGISGVHTQASAWMHAGAQIDLLIDRADQVISVCEVKFTEAPFTITKKYAEELRNKLAVFRAQTGTRKQLQLVFIAAAGIAKNAYADELVDRTITLDELVEEGR